MTRAKYIIIDNGISPESPIVFPAWLTHCDMARDVGGTVLSAGFVEFLGDGSGDTYCSVTGESVSLKSKPREHDGKIIAKALGLGG